MARYLVDSAGRVWDPYDHGLLQELGDPDPDYDIIEYAVRNLGFVSVDAQGAGEFAALIRFRRLCLTDTALSVTRRLIATLPNGPIKIMCETEQWEEFSFPDADAALSWLSSGSPTLAGTFRDITTLPRGLSSLSERRLNSLDQHEDLFALLFKKWRMTSGVFTPDFAQFMVRFGILDRAVIAAESQSSLVFQHIGLNINLYAGHQEEGWNFRMAGQPVSAQPDPNVAKYTELAFRNSLDKNEPAFDHVDAVIRDTEGARRHRYDRLLLPWRSNEGEVRMVTTLSYKTDPDLVLS